MNKQNKPSPTTLELVKRMMIVKEANVISKNYTSDYYEMFPKKKPSLDTLRNVWNYKGLISHVDIVENFELMAKSKQILTKENA